MAKGARPKRSRLGRRERVDWLTALAARPITQFLGFAAFVFAVVGIITVGQTSESRVSEYQAGEVAPRDIKATRDFVFVEKDLEASEKERERAAREVPHVYDWQEGLGESLRDRVSLAFSGMRQQLADRIVERLEREDPQRLEALRKEPGQLDLNQALLALVNAQQRVAIARDLRADHFDGVLGVALRDTDFETFARLGFPERAENALAGVIGEVMANIIVPSRRIIETEEPNGVFLRRLRNDKLLIEYHVANVGARALPLERVPSLVEEVAAARLVSIGDRELRSAIASTATALVQPNTTFNAAETAAKRESARRSVGDRVLREEFRSGQIIVDRGHIISPRHLRIIEQMEAEQRILGQTQIVAGAVVLCLLLVVTLFLFGRRNIRKFHPNAKDIVFMAATMLLLLFVTKLGILLSRAIVEQLTIVPAQAWFYAIPVAASGMLIRLVLNSEHAIVFTVLFAVFAGLMAEHSLFFMTYAAIGGLVGAGSVRRVTNRMGLLRSGLTVAAVNIVAVVGFLLVNGEFLQIDSVDSVAQSLGFMGLAFVGGIASGSLVLVLLPLSEWLFRYTTDIELLELSNLNHPALRELILRAPGSYHHSMMVGSLCEAAAEAIGCNALLARVGSYYHDIGKGKNPQYFAENQRLGENPHDRLKPNISALVIKAHVKDGLEMARQYRLPAVIQDFIVQHHGTSLIRYFYHKAKMLEDPDIPEVVEADYRYPGPKPQTRETAICLLADGIEAASRAMPDPTPARLKGLVQKMINIAFTDGQLDECDLTLKDLNLIADAFHRILTGIYHHRPEYPGERRRADQKTNEADRVTQEAKRKSKRTDRPRRLTPTPPGTGPKTETDLPEVTPDASGDWEITQDQIDNIEDALNAGRNLSEREGEAPPDDDSSAEDDSEEGRQSLPRLGSH